MDNTGRTVSFLPAILVVVYTRAVSRSTCGGGVSADGACRQGESTGFAPPPLLLLALLGLVARRFTRPT